MCTQYYKLRLKNFTNIAQLRDYYQAAVVSQNILAIRIASTAALPIPMFAVRRILLKKFGSRFLSKKLQYLKW